MTYFHNIEKRINKTDCALYAVSILLGVAIVLSNYYLNTPENRMTAMDAYLTQILTRIDSVTGQLGVWGHLDLKHNRGY